MDFDTLTTNNDPYAMKQEIQDLNIMLDEIEQERDDARAEVKRLEGELKKANETLQNNQLNLIEPLQNKIQELESIVDDKEADIKKRYKRKLRKYKREIEIERKINEKLKGKISRHQSKTREEGSFAKLYNVETTSYGDENENKRYLSSKTDKNRKSRKKIKAAIAPPEDCDNYDDGLDINTSKNLAYNTAVDKENIQPNQTVRRNKSQTLTGNRALKLGELLRNNTPAHMSTHKNLRDYLLKIETSQLTW